MKTLILVVAVLGSVACGSSNDSATMGNPNQTQNSNQPVGASAVFQGNYSITLSPNGTACSAETHAWSIASTADGYTINQDEDAQSLDYDATVTDNTLSADMEFTFTYASCYVQRHRVVALTKNADGSLTGTLVQSQGNNTCTDGTGVAACSFTVQGTVQ